MLLNVSENPSRVCGPRDKLTMLTIDNINSAIDVYYGQLFTGAGNLAENGVRIPAGTKEQIQNHRGELWVGTDLGVNGQIRVNKTYAN